MSTPPPPKFPPLPSSGSGPAAPSGAGNAPPPRPGAPAAASPSAPAASPWGTPPSAAAGSAAPSGGPGAPSADSRPAQGGAAAPAPPSATSGAKDAVKGAAGDQLKSRVPYADKIDQGKRVLDAGRQGGVGAGAEEAAAMGGAAAARAGATALTGGLSDAAGAVAPGVNKAIDKIGEAVGRGGYKAVVKVATASIAALVVLVIALTGGLSSVVATLSGGSASGPPRPNQEQCESMPQDWCDVVYDAQRAARNRTIAVPWTVVAGIARVATDYGRTSPYDTVDRDPSRPTPPYLAANFAQVDTAASGGTLGNVPYNAGSLAWGGHSNGQIPAAALCPISWATNHLLECGAQAALEALNAKYKAEHGGANLHISDAYRDLAGQQYQRARWCGQGKCGNAAVPGTSNHGWGKAVDLGNLGGYNGESYLWLKANSTAFGWHHPAFMEPGGKGPFEPWHWEFRGGGGSAGVAQASFRTPASGGGAVSAGVSASGSTCDATTPSTPIGGQGREAEGPFLLLPAAAQELREDGGDPQNPCDAAEFVAGKLQRAARDVIPDLGKPAAGDQEGAATFWQAVISHAGIIASPDEASGECLVAGGTATDLPVDQLIERIWSCEISQAREVHVVSSVGTAAGSAGTSYSEYTRETARSVLIAEAKSVAWAASRYGATECVESAATAGVFPLTAQQATGAGAVARCDIQTNIRAAARIVLAGEAVPAADRPKTGGPFAPMLGGWASIPAALGQDAATFPATGPKGSWAASPTCSAELRTAALAAAMPGSPFGDLATATSAPRDGSTYAAHLGSWPEPVRAACGTATDAELAAHAATITLAEASTIPGVGVPRTDGPAATPAPLPTEPPALEPLPEGVVLGGFGFSVPTAPAADGADAQALLGLTNWLTWQAVEGAPAAAVFGQDSVVPRLSTNGAIPEVGPISDSATTIAADPWQQRVTEWAIFYGGLVRPWDTHGQRTGSLVASLTGAAGQYAVLAGDTTAQATAIIEAAKKYLGTPYSWGGGGVNGPARGIDGGANTVGFDCSGLTEYAFAQAGYQIGGTTAVQKDKGTTISSMAEAVPGDLLFFGSPIRHVAIYLGDNQLIHAPKPGDVVKISPVYETPVLIKRVIEPRAAAEGTVDSWIASALGLLYANGFPRGLDDTAALKLIIDHESSGNPAAVNKTDSNAQAGHPSFGLMQTIPSTFDAHALPGHTDKNDPVAQIMAGARYAQSRYGGLDNVPGVKSVRAGGAYVGY